MAATEPECLYLGDKFERCMRKCIVFPADGSATRIEHMIVETVTSAEKITALQWYNRCVDLTNTFGEEHRDLLTRSTTRSLDADQPNDSATHIIFYNRSPRLPINLNVANLVGETAVRLKTKKRSFWRGDIVVMGIRPLRKGSLHMVQTLDADLSELGPLEERLRDMHREGYLEREQYFDEDQWKEYVVGLGVFTYWFGGQKAYWGKNAAQKEDYFLFYINEQRSAIGRAPFLRPDHMKPGSIYSSLQSAFRHLLLGQEAAGSPKLPPELERQIFETCALDCPGVCTTLILVSKRVYTWIDPILIATVCIEEHLFQLSRKHGEMKSFLFKLTSGRMPVEYYAQHVKNLAIFGGRYEKGEIDRVLAICTGVENLVINKMVILNQPVKSLTFFDNPQAGMALRRLYVNLWWNTSESAIKFDHACFRNLTHLHLVDDNEHWPFYKGWENLEHLTHLAFAYCVPEQLEPVMQVLPAIRYVALGHYCTDEQYRHVNVVVNSSPHIRAAWGVHVVFLRDISYSDWQGGARGEGDFWNVVEDEVERRLQDGSG